LITNIYINNSCSLSLDSSSIIMHEIH